MDREKSAQISKLPFVLIVGAIGVGKTTTTKMLRDKLELDFEFEIQESLEQVDKWKRSKILKNFYEDMKRYAYSFQQYVFADRLSQFLDYNLDSKDMIIADGHVLVDRWCFAQMLFESGFINEEEMNWYLSTFKNWRKMIPVADPDIIIYLKLEDTNIAIDRISKRDRKEETGIKTDYLAALQAKIEFMNSKEELKDRVITIDGSKTQEEIISIIMNDEKFSSFINKSKNKKYKKISNPIQLDTTTTTTNEFLEIKIQS